MFSKLSILQKGLALLIVPLLLQAVFAGYFLWRLAYRNDVERWAIHTKEVIAQAATLFRMLTEADGQVSVFAAIGDERKGTSFHRVVAEVPVQEAKLNGLVSDNPPQLQRLAAISAQATRATGQMDELSRIAQAHDAPRVNAKLREIADADLLAEIRRGLDGFIGEEEKLDRVRLAELRTTQSHQFWTLIGGTAALLLVGSWCIWVFGSTIVRRLGILNENVRRIGSGEPLGPRVGGSDEITTLDESFHQMAASLAAATAKEREAQASLERRALELTTVNRELTQKSEENEMFVYSVSHDLRSPLVNLQGFSKELSLSIGELRDVLGAAEVPAGTRTQGEDILKHGMAEPVGFIQSAVTRLSAIIDALLRLSRAGKVEYRHKEIDTGEVVRRVIDASRAVIAEKKARVSVAGALPRVWGDPTAVEQIFANLVGNALNYLDKQRAGVIEVGSVSDEADPVLATCYVKDNGLGIPEAYREKVFGVFQRVHGNVAVGEGIGLALVRRMVERHGGRIWVESDEGVGSTFFVTLPKVNPLAAPEAAPTDTGDGEPG